MEHQFLSNPLYALCFKLRLHIVLFLCTVYHYMELVIDFVILYYNVFNGQRCAQNVALMKGNSFKYFLSAGDFNKINYYILALLKLISVSAEYRQR